MYRGRGCANGRGREYLIDLLERLGCEPRADVPVSLDVPSSTDWGQTQFQRDASKHGRLYGWRQELSRDELRAIEEVVAALGMQHLLWQPT
jgi:hypothetical protein